MYECNYTRALVVFVCATTLNSCPGSSTENVFLTGTGASFPYPIYAKWFYAYRQQHPNVLINYQSIGSGGGIRQLLAGTVDFAATDIPLTSDQMSRFSVPVEHFASVVGAVVASYNLPGRSSELRLTPEILAGVYLGQITRWNDAVLASANPGVPLPDKEIVVVHRSDGSGTDIRMDGLPWQSQPALEEESGYRSCRAVAHRPWSKGK